MTFDQRSLPSCCFYLRRVFNGRSKFELFKTPYRVMGTSTLADEIHILQLCLHSDALALNENLNIVKPRRTEF
jgi:hypothetical protein